MQETLQYLIILGIPLGIVGIINLVMVLFWRRKIAGLMLARVMFIANAAAFLLGYVWAFLNSHGKSYSEYGFEGVAMFFSAIGLMLFLLIAFLFVGSWVLREIRKTRDTKGHAFVMDFTISSVFLVAAAVLIKRLVGEDWYHFTFSLAI